MTRSALRGTAALSGMVAVAHAAPALASLRPLRMQLTPALAGQGDPDHVAFTFDDGPHPMSTPKFLAVLERLEVRATFFLLGSCINRAPSLGADLVAAGHEIGLHGYDHRCLIARGPKGTYDDLARGRDAVAEHTGVVPRWYRPPYGVLTSSTLVTAKRLGLIPVLWTTWGRDWTSRATPETVYRTVMRNLAGGATVLLHDSDVTSAPGAWRSALGAVPRLVQTCRERGLRVGPLAEHGIRAEREIPVEAASRAGV